MIDEWKRQLKERSGNLTTNEVMPEYLVEKLLDEDISCKEKLKFEEIHFPRSQGLLGEVEGLNILSGLQKIKKEGYLTLFRAVRFPTYKRIFEMLSSDGFAISNYEQERILHLYKNEDYLQKREEIKDYYKRDNVFEIDFEACRARGVDLHEMYSQNLPSNIKEAEEVGISQDFFLLDIYRINDEERVNKLFSNTKLLKENKYFLHGFFGDQNIFGRRRTKYLPSRCFRVNKV